MHNRLIKILFGCCISMYMLLVCFNDITDYGSNLQFVRMVAGMDDVFSNAHTGWRAVQSNWLVHLMYLGIIAFEVLVAAFAIVGTYRMIRNLRSDATSFNVAKKAICIALGLGVILWFGLFIAIGGEWFLMWQSEAWNGQQTAFFLTICFLLFLVYISRHDD
jgi:predicted small integral membrane protein